MSGADPTFLSLYSGAGGLDLGFSDAGFECLWANDVDADSVATHRWNLEGDAVHGDIEVLKDTVPADLRPDVIIGGPPCQGFSVAGHMRPDDPRSKHVWTFLHMVNAHEPQAFVMENVAALAVNQRWAGLVDALRAYADSMGYTTRVAVLNASHYGVPQARQRMFLLGSRAGMPKLPRPTSEAQPPTVREALAALPAYREPGNDLLCTAKVTPARNPVLRRSPYAGMLFNGKGRALNLEAPASTLPASMGGNRTPVIDQDLIDGRAGTNWIIGYHARLWDGGRPRRTIPKRMRRLTVQEAAALQTFPPDWAFVGPQSSQFRQIGNAVPPALAYHVAMSLRESLATAKTPRVGFRAALAA